MKNVKYKKLWADRQKRCNKHNESVWKQKKEKEDAYQKFIKEHRFTEAQETSLREAINERRKKGSSVLA